MLIKPFTVLRDEYTAISDLCKEKREPILLTKNGEDDLIVMSIETYQFREEMLDLREKLLLAEANRLSGAKTYSTTEVSDRLIDGSVPKYKSKGGRPKTLTDAHIIQIMRWKAENVSNCEIARRLHVTETTIRRHIKSYTVNIRENES